MTTTLTVMRGPKAQPSALIMTLRASWNFTLEQADDLARTGGSVSVPTADVDKFALDVMRCGYVVKHG